MKTSAIGLVILCAAAFCTAQDPSTVASITVEQPSKSYRLDEMIWLNVTVTNLSKATILFEESHRGQWEAEVYDPNDPSGKDLALPNKQKHAFRGEPETRVIQWPVEAGSSITTRVLLGKLSDTVSKPGTYKVILDKREFVNNVVIRSSPVIVQIAP
jgi:hypothetical protein